MPWADIFWQFVITTAMNPGCWFTIALAAIGIGLIVGNEVDIRRTDGDQENKE